MAHGVVFLGILFAGESLSTDAARKRLRLDMCTPVNIQTAALRELFAACVTGERTVSGVSPFVCREVTGVGKLSTAPRAGVQGTSPTSRVSRVDVKTKIRLTAE